MTPPTAIATIWLVAFAAANVWAHDAPPEPSGYRMENYRGPTPATLDGARVVTTAQAEELWKSAAIFVDVYPRVRRPDNLPPETIWREPVRLNIPGSIWLPDTGYGALTPAAERYLRGNLDRATDGDNQKWLVIYCRQECWMSWNAAKRVLAMGYRNVAWYPEGTDGWGAFGLPLQKAIAVSAEGE
jgi:PQQ-dependent catabolism-associated CXXCW motif protein